MGSRCIEFMRDGPTRAPYSAGSWRCFQKSRAQRLAANSWLEEECVEQGTRAASNKSVGSTMSLIARGLFVLDAYCFKNTLQTTSARRKQTPSAGKRTFRTKH